VRRETAGRYLRVAGLAVRRRSGTEPREAKAATQVSTDSAAEPRPSRSPQTSACEPYREWLTEGMAAGRTAMALWQDLVDGHGFASSYARVKRFAIKLRSEALREAHPVIETAPGEEAQMRYSDEPMVHDPEAGKYRRTRLFVLTLGYSRKSVRLLKFRSSTQIWAELHERAFRRLGGVTRVVVLDNLKEGVLQPEVIAALPEYPRDPSKDRLADAREAPRARSERHRRCPMNCLMPATA